MRKTSKTNFFSHKVTTTANDKRNHSFRDSYWEVDDSLWKIEAQGLALSDFISILERTGYGSE